MSTKAAARSSQEYVTVPLAELVESSTNPRKTFNEERLEELAPWSNASTSWLSWPCR